MGENMNGTFISFVCCILYTAFTVTQIIRRETVPRRGVKSNIFLIPRADICSRILFETW